MAKLKDKFFNRTIEGQLELDASEKAEQDASAVKAVEGASAGTIDKVLGLSAQGKLVKGSVSGGTQLYKHTIKNLNEANEIEGLVDITLISTSSTPITPNSTYDEINELLNNSIRIYTSEGLYVWLGANTCILLESPMSYWDDISLSAHQTTTDTVTPL